MPSWRKGQRLVALCEQRKQRVQSEIARIERARLQSVALVAQLEAQLLDLNAMLNEHQGHTGVMSKLELYQARRHLAVLLRQKNDLRLERDEAQREVEALQQQSEQQRLALLLAEKKRNKYYDWMVGQRRLARWRQALAEQSETEERIVC
jgi:hypothetical protein